MFLIFYNFRIHIRAFETTTVLYHTIPYHTMPCHALIMYSMWATVSTCACMKRFVIDELNSLTCSMTGVLIQSLYHHMYVRMYSCILCSVFKQNYSCSCFVCHLASLSSIVIQWEIHLYHTIAYHTVTNYILDLQLWWQRENKAAAEERDWEKDT